MGELVTGGSQGTLVSVSGDELFSFLAKEIRSSLAVWAVSKMSYSSPTIVSTWPTAILTLCLGCLCVAYDALWRRHGEASCKRSGSVM